jgi:hypothetical protein
MPNPKIRTTLDMHHDLACQVGLVVAEYALLERLLFSIYALLAPAEPSTSLGTFYALHSLRERKRITLRVACPLLQPSYLTALKRLLRRFSNATNRRTEVAHCEYMADDVHVMRLGARGGGLFGVPRAG